MTPVVVGMKSNGSAQKTTPKKPILTAVDAGRRVVKSKKATPPAKPVVPKVRIRLQSKPSRAGVYAGRRKLGTTPMTLVRPQENKALKLTYRRKDYRSLSFKVNLTGSTTITKSLKPIIELLPQ